MKLTMLMASIVLCGMSFRAYATEEAGSANELSAASAPAVAGQPAPAASGGAVIVVPAAPSLQASPQAPQNKSRLTFMDSKLFDAKLSRELASGKEVVEIDVTGHVSLNDIPERMDRWVVKSAEEGKVELLLSEPAPKTRFLFSLIPMVFNAVGSLKSFQEERMFDHATKYDTKIYYKKENANGDAVIEKIVLIRRKPN